MAEEFRVAHGAVGLWEAGLRTIPGPVLKLIELYEEELNMSHPTESRRTLTTLPTSWASRSLKLSKTTAAITARLAAAALERALASGDAESSIRQNAQAAIARQLVERLGEMKGFAMKVGQMLSYLDFAMPEAARETLATLQSSSTPMSAAVVAGILMEDFGQSPRALFAEWEPEPFAAASIGQVHRARLHTGERVVVKVQYPDIAKTIEADLRNAGIIDQLGSLIFRGQEKGAFIAELRERFLEECDYRKEAENQEHFRALYAGSPEIVIPRVFEGLSSRRVLTSELADGQTFQEFAASATQTQKNRAAETLWRFAFESIFRHNLFNGDPHPGNYLFRDGQVVFLDFGCVKRFTPEFIARWKSFVRAVLDQRHDDADRIIVEMGMVPDPTRYDFESHREMVLALYAPWLFDEEFEFRSDFVTTTWKLMAAKNPNKARMNLPKDWVFTNRLQWGLYAILASLRAKANWRRKIIELVYDPGVPHPNPYSKGAS